MLILRLLTIAVWSIVLVYMAPAVWALFTGKARKLDPARLDRFIFAFIMVAGNARWLFAPNDAELWAAIYVLCIASGIYTFVVARSYGRGPHVH